MWRIFLFDSVCSVFDPPIYIREAICHCISVGGETEKSKIANNSQTMRPTDAILTPITALEDPYLVMTSSGHAHFRFRRKRAPNFIFETQISSQRLDVSGRFLRHMAWTGLLYKTGTTPRVAVVPFGGQSPPSEKIRFDILRFFCKLRFFLNLAHRLGTMGSRCREILKKSQSPFLR